MAKEGELMEEKERLDIAIGILDDTENVIERIKNQHKFEKDYIDDQLKELKKENKI